MELSVTEKECLTIIKVVGRLDTVTAADFEKEGLNWLNQGKNNLALDFSALEYISSAGLRSVLVLGKKAKAIGGSLTICGLSGLVAEVFSMSGFDSFFPIYASIDDLLRDGGNNE